MSRPTLPQKAHSILTSPKKYYNSQKETLDAMLEDVSINEASIINTASQNLIRDKLMGFFKVTDVINTMINWNETVDADIRRAKKEYLLHEVIIDFQSQGEEIDLLKHFISDPAGNTLYNKIVRILENFPPDEQLSRHLAKAIRHIVQTDFVGLFESHKYAISQIEQLTPQALTILVDNPNWPEFDPGTTVAHGKTITSDWLPTFTNAYCRAKQVSDLIIGERIGHSIGLLKTNGYMVAQTQEGKGARCYLTSLGANILPYICA
nr:hypothetical protein [Pseudodesulfovibrio sp.]